MLLRKLLAEVIGTFALLFAGMMAIANGAGLLGVALAHGLAISFSILALGGVGGGNFNPAVSVGLSLAGKQDWVTTLMYIPAQLIGAALGALAALGVAGSGLLSKVGYAGTALGSGVTVGQGVLAEAVTTFFLVLVVIKAAAEKEHLLASLLIGLTITVGILAVGPISGASLNPARAFGSAVAGAGWANHWVYWAGPLLGAALAAGLSYVLKDEE